MSYTYLTAREEGYNLEFGTSSGRQYKINFPKNPAGIDRAVHSLRELNKREEIAPETAQTMEGILREAISSGDIFLW